MAQKKRAAVYDRWLHTLGGGEQLAFAYAEVLRDLGYQVDLLTHKAFDTQAAINKMAVNFSGITVKYVPNLLDFQLSNITEKYDVFVSNSYMDYIPNRSKFGILCIFFPSKISLNLYEYLKRTHVVPTLRKFFLYPSSYEGFLYDSFEKGYLHKWLGEKSTITINETVQKFSLQLFFQQMTSSSLEQIYFTVNEKRIIPKIKVNHLTNIVKYSFNLLTPPKSSKISIHIPKEDAEGTISLVSFFIPHYRYLLYNLFKRFVPVWEMRLHGGPSSTKYSDVESYDKIIAISRFTQHWITKYWHMASEVIYPPVASKNFQPSLKKENIILHVGRFFVGGHSKKQLEMVRVFKRLVDQGVTDWELHFVGGVAEGYLHQLYLNKIKEETEDYPVYIHTDAPFPVLKNLLSKAKIYWHATGLDENDKKNPILLEHFGITTVEAMASGCVPVVINKGGQPEIVTPESGFIWNTRRQLLEYTLQLIKRPDLLKKMSRAALQRSQTFSRHTFKEQLKKLIDEKNS